MKKLTELTPQQIKELYEFTRAHYVEYYDVQTELVDHLANDIESIMNTDLNISFEGAKELAFKKFGVFGFMDVVNERQKALGKKYRNILWSFAREWFQLPKIFVSLFLIFVFYKVLSIPASKGIVLSIYILLLFPILLKGMILQKKFKKRFKITGKKWMLEEYIYKTGFSNFGLFYSLIVNIQIYDFLNETVFQRSLIAGLSVSFLVISYLILQVIPSKSEKLLEENYPEYKIVR